jgi:putative addiction module antidote
VDELVYYYRSYNPWPYEAALSTAKEHTMAVLKLTQIGNSVGVVLPKELLARLKVVKGHTLFVTEAANGLMLTPYDPALDEQLAIGREFMREYRDTFHQLAK